MHPMPMVPLWHPLVESTHTNSVHVTGYDAVPHGAGAQGRTKYAANRVLKAAFPNGTTGGLT